jgi:hypothetical protein
MAEVQKTVSILTFRSIVIGVVCIVTANLLLELLGRMVELPSSDSLESMLATGAVVIVWFAIVMRVKG